MIFLAGGWKIFTTSTFYPERRMRDAYMRARTELIMRACGISRDADVLGTARGTADLDF